MYNLNPKIKIHRTLIIWNKIGEVIKILNGNLKKNNLFNFNKKLFLFLIYYYFFLKAHYGSINQIEFFDKDKLATCSSDKHVKIFNFKTFNCLKTVEIMEISENEIHSIAVKNNMLACCGDFKFYYYLIFIF